MFEPVKPFSPGGTIFIVSVDEWRSKLLLLTFLLDLPDKVRPINFSRSLELLLDVVVRVVALDKFKMFDGLEGPSILSVLVEPANKLLQLYNGRGG